MCKLVAGANLVSGTGLRRWVTPKMAREAPVHNSPEPGFNRLRAAVTG